MGRKVRTAVTAKVKSFAKLSTPAHDILHTVHLPLESTFSFRDCFLSGDWEGYTVDLALEFLAPRPVLVQGEEDADHMEGVFILLFLDLHLSHVHLHIIHEPVELDLLVHGHLHTCDLSSQRNQECILGL